MIKLAHCGMVDAVGGGRWANSPALPCKSARSSSQRCQNVCGPCTKSMARMISLGLCSNLWRKPSR
eukprot:6473774-Amphidinium_carterae.1